MSFSLPLNQFKWMTPEGIENVDELAIPEGTSTDCILEVDPEYPNELHDSQNDFPFCPQWLKTTYIKNVAKKLMGTLHDKFLICPCKWIEAEENSLRNSFPSGSLNSATWTATTDKFYRNCVVCQCEEFEALPQGRICSSKWHGLRGGGDWKKREFSQTYR